MSQDVRNYDAVVVGAGSAGSSTAWRLAETGMRTALVERMSIDRAGAHWVNGIAPWMLETAGVPIGDENELHDHGAPMLIFDHDDNLRVTVDPNPIWKMDMRMLTSRLHGFCRESGVDIFERTECIDLELDDGRPFIMNCRRQCEDGEKEDISFRARLFVDASGLGGSVRKHIPDIETDCPPVAAVNRCSAVQEICEISDIQATMDYLTRMKSPPEHILSWLGVEGGFSTVNIAIDRDYSRADMLVGASMEAGNRSGPALLASFKNEKPWIGKKLMGGSSIIPIRRPYDAFTSTGFACVGDSACQVFPLHGSGVGLGLIAGRLLADKVSRYYDPGSLEATWSYQSAFQRKYGRILGGYDIIRRATQNLGSEKVGLAFKSGLIGSGMTVKGLNQDPPIVGLSDLVESLKGIAKEPKIGAGLGLSFTRIPAVMALYAAYPGKPGRRKLALWSRAVAEIFGEEPDIRRL